MQAIIEKPNWHNKLKDEGIRRKWTDEAAEQKVRTPLAEYALKELDWCASVRDDVNGAEPSGIDFVWVCDFIPPTAIINLLQFL